MATQSSLDINPHWAPDGTLSLFDRENLEYLDALRYENLRVRGATPAPPSGSGSASNATADVDAEGIFKTFQIEDDDERWGMGELNVKIIHRGRIRISRSEWRQIVNTCSAGISEHAIRKDFHLNILQHASSVRLVYISYRYKQSGDKQRECRRGILAGDGTNIRELMMRLSFWFTAQPHAEKNDALLKGLVDEAMVRLEAQASNNS